MTEQEFLVELGAYAKEHPFRRVSYGNLYLLRCGEGYEYCCPITAVARGRGIVSGVGEAWKCGRELGLSPEDLRKIIHAADYSSDPYHQTLLSAVGL